MVQTDEDSVEVGAYQDEPIASTKWIEKYNEGQKGVIQLESELMKRLGFSYVLIVSLTTKKISEEKKNQTEVKK